MTDKLLSVIRPPAERGAESQIPENTAPPLAGKSVQRSQENNPVQAAPDHAADDPRNLIVLGAPGELPPVLAGHATAQVQARAASFYVHSDHLAGLYSPLRPGAAALIDG
jgi:hypothetical protein